VRGPGVRAGTTPLIVRTGRRYRTG